jgi:hypothetical protein
MGSTETVRPRGVVIVARIYEAAAVILILSMPGVMLGDMMEHMRSWTASIPIVMLLGTAGILLFAIALGLLNLRSWALYGAVGVGTLTTLWYVYKLAIDPSLSWVAAGTMIILAAAPSGYLVCPAIRGAFAHPRAGWSWRL